MKKLVALMRRLLRRCLYKTIPLATGILSQLPKGHYQLVVSDGVITKSGTIPITAFRGLSFKGTFGLTIGDGDVTAISGTSPTLIVHRFVSSKFLTSFLNLTRRYWRDALTIAAEIVSILAGLRQLGFLTTSIQNPSK